MNGAALHEDAVPSIPLIWVIRGITLCGWLFIFAAASMMIWMQKPNYESVRLLWYAGFGLQLAMIITRVRRELGNQADGS
jgi:hypothetical protein